ncbi:MAG: helix-turn-helix transcriptional regulator [Dehalococcoidales bacterium]|nr:helix-turn-helix transcriptional regulator [Dehalococcoidales bacterium]
MLIVELKREALEEHLIRQNCSRKELAYRIGVSRSYLSAILTGRKNPSPGMRQRFIEYFSCSFDDLFLIRDGEKCQTS